LRLGVKPSIFSQLHTPAFEINRFLDGRSANGKDGRLLSGSEARV
jgi:hypothetical protein